MLIEFFFELAYGKNYVCQHLRRGIGIFSAAFCALHSDKDGFSQKDVFSTKNVFLERFPSFYTFL